MQDTALTTLNVGDTVLTKSGRIGTIRNFLTDGEFPGTHRITTECAKYALVDFPGERMLNGNTRDCSDYYIASTLILIGRD